MGKYVEVAPTFFKFEKEGDKVEGVYTFQTQIEVAGKPTRRYVIATKEDNVTFLGGAQLDTLMDMVEIGDQVLVTFKGTAPTRKGTDVKIFSVQKMEG